MVPLDCCGGAGVAGVDPVRVPARVHLQMDGNPERRAGSDGPDFRDQRGFDVRRLIGAQSRAQTEDSNRGEEEPRSKHSGSLDSVTTHTVNGFGYFQIARVKSDSVT